MQTCLILLKISSILYKRHTIYQIITAGNVRQPQSQHFTATTLTVRCYNFDDSVLCVHIYIYMILLISHQKGVQMGVLQDYYPKQNPRWQVDKEAIGLEILVNFGFWIFLSFLISKLRCFINVILRPQVLLSINDAYIYIWQNMVVTATQYNM